MTEEEKLNRKQAELLQNLKENLFELRIEMEEYELSQISRRTQIRRGYYIGAVTVLEDVIKKLSTLPKQELKLVEFEAKDTGYPYEFIAAVPYADARDGGCGTRWWVRHCVLHEHYGLCVFENDNITPAEWLITDVTHWAPLPVNPIIGKP